jgi:hypothetical protein
LAAGGRQLLSPLFFSLFLALWVPCRLIVLGKEHHWREFYSRTPGLSTSFTSFFLARFKSLSPDPEGSAREFDGAF